MKVTIKKRFFGRNSVEVINFDLTNVVLKALAQESIFICAVCQGKENFCIEDIEKCQECHGTGFILKK